MLGFPVDPFVPAPPIALDVFGLPRGGLFVDILGLGNLRLDILGLGILRLGILRLGGLGFASATGVPDTPTTIADFTALRPALAGLDVLRLQAPVIDPVRTNGIVPTAEYRLVLGG